MSVIFNNNNKTTPAPPYHVEGKMLLVHRYFREKGLKETRWNYNAAREEVGHRDYLVKKITNQIIMYFKLKYIILIENIWSKPYS